MANELNNRAVSLLVQGKLQDAQAVLGGALNDILSGMLLHRQAIDAGLDPAAVPVAGEPKTNPLPCMVDEAQLAFSPYNAYAFYDRAILLPDQDFHPDEMAVVLLYNTGLVFHARGFCNASNTLLRKATKVYNMALAFAQESDVSATSSFMSMAQLAIRANLGNIAAHQGRDDQARDHYDTLQAILEQSLLILPTMEWMLFYHMVVIHQTCSRPTISSAA